jgi:hypothetical protein
MGVPKFPKLGVLQLCGPITLCANLRLRWGLKQSCSLRQELFNEMWNVTYTQGNWVDSRLLVVGSQIGNLTLDLSFGHNLCFKCPNGSCELILDMYVSIFFQWYKKLFNSMGFDPCNCSLKIWESIGSPTSKVGAHLWVWGFLLSHFPALPRSIRCSSRAPFLSRTLASPCLDRKPKAGVATVLAHSIQFTILQCKRLCYPN